MCCPYTKCAVKILLVVGGLNWGLVGLAMLFGAEGTNWNVVNLLIGAWPVAEGIVYLLVGLAAVFRLVTWGYCCGGSCGMKK